MSECFKHHFESRTFDLSMVSSFGSERERERERIFSTKFDSSGFNAERREKGANCVSRFTLGLSVRLNVYLMKRKVVESEK